MTQVDGLSLPVRLPIDGDAFDAACEYARIHDLTISAAASEMLRSFAPSVEQGLRPPAPEDGREGSGEPPASLPSVSWWGGGGQPFTPASTKPVDRSQWGQYLCTAHLGLTQDAPQCLEAAEVDVLDENGEWDANCACPEHHPFPPLTLEESKALHPSSRPVVEYVDQCVYCGERSKHGRCS